MIPDSSLRLAAEWEPHGCVLLALPHQNTDWAHMLPEITQCYVLLINALVSTGSRVALIVPGGKTDIPLPPAVQVIDVETNDTWIRDYGPLTMLAPDGTPTLLDFRFNGWGLKFAANLDNLVNRRMPYAAPLLCMKDMVLEGGSIETDGRGTLLTTACCLSAPNRNEPLTLQQIERQLMARLNCRKVLTLHHGSLMGDDTDGHIDTLCRMAPHNTIIFTGCHNPDDPHLPALRAMFDELRTFTNADGQPFNLIELPLPDPIYDPDDGSRLPATYANYLVTDHAVITPVYGQPMNDRLACDTLRVVFPNRQIVPVNSLPLIRQHGSIHCASMQVPLSVLTRK